MKTLAILVLSIAAFASVANAGTTKIPPPTPAPMPVVTAPAPDYSGSAFNPVPSPRGLLVNDFNDANKFLEAFDVPSTAAPFDDGDISAQHPGNATIQSYPALPNQIAHLLPYNYNYDEGSVEVRVIVGLPIYSDQNGAHSAKLFLGDQNYNGTGTNGFLIERVSQNHGMYYKVTLYRDGAVVSTTLVSDFAGEEASVKTDVDGYVSLHFAANSTSAAVKFYSANSVLQETVSGPIDTSNFSLSIDVSAIYVNRAATNPVVVLDYFASRLLPTSTLVAL
jgi:hypothetical protein